MQAPAAARHPFSRRRTLDVLAGAIGVVLVAGTALLHALSASPHGGQTRATPSAVPEMPASSQPQTMQGHRSGQDVIAIATKRLHDGPWPDATATNGATIHR